MRRFSLHLIILLFLVTGCSTVPRQHFYQVWRPKAEKIVEKNDQKIDQNDAKIVENLKEQIRQLEAKLQAVSGPVAAAKDVNQANPAQNQHTSVVNKELTTAQADLPPPTAQQLKDNLERTTLALSKEIKDREKAEAMYSGLLDQSTKREELYTKTLNENAKLVAENQGLTKTNNELLTTIADHAKEKAAKAKEDAESNKLLQRYLMIGAGIFLLASIALLYFQQKELAGYAGAATAVCFGAAWLIGQWWFPLLVIAIIAGAIGYQFLSSRKKQQLLELEAKAKNTAVRVIQGVQNSKEVVAAKVAELRAAGKISEAEAMDKADDILREELDYTADASTEAHVIEIKKTVPSVV